MPDGRHFLYFGRSTDARYRGVYVGDLENPDTGLRVLDVNGLAAYGSGYLVFVRDGVMFAQAFDTRSFKLSGEPIRVADGVGYFHGITGYNAVTASADGTLAFGPSIGTTTSLQWHTRSGALAGHLGRPGVYSSPRLSFDGKTVAVSVASPTTGDRDIWALDVARDAESRVTSDAETDWFPVWSPDGQRIFFASTRLGASTIFQKVGVGPDELFDKAAIEIVNYPDDVSPDGRLLAYTQTGKNGYDIGIATVGTPLRKTWFLNTAFNETQPRFAPNMRFLAYVSDETGTSEVYVRPYPSGNTAWRVSLAGGSQPEWRRDGRELFFLAADGKLMAVPVSTDTEFHAGAPQSLFDVDVPEFTQPYENSYAVTADGQQFLINSVVDQPNRPAMTIILNWTAALKK